MTSYFDRVVVINLKRRADRLESFRSAVISNGWPFKEPVVFEAVDGNKVPGGNTWACLESHRQVIERAIMDDVQSLLVLEDDAIPCNDFAQRVGEFLNNVPADWENLMLGGHCYTGELLPVAPGVIAVAGCERMHCYALRGQFLRDYYGALCAARQGEHCDHILMNVQKDRRVYAPYPFLVDQAAGHSDIKWETLSRRDWQPSGSAAFPRSIPAPKYPKLAMAPKMRLIVNYFRSLRAERAAEFDFALRASITNERFDAVIVLAQDDPPFEMPPHVEWVRADYSEKPKGRPTFADYFDAANDRVAHPADVSVVANADILFERFPVDLKECDIAGKLLGLSRWEPRSNAPHELEINPDGLNGQDVWIFSGRLPPIAGSDRFGMGIWDCDPAMAWMLSHAGMHTINPCRDFVTVHHHKSGIRTYNHDGMGPQERIPPCTLAESTITKGRGFRGVIAFSLWGRGPKYNHGIVQNARLAKVIYPGWLMRVYHDDSTPQLVREELSRLDVELVEMPTCEGNSGGMFWRFLAADDPAFDAWIVRDADSRLSYRERRAVDDWLASGKGFHAMHDHPHHQKPIMGCALGGRRGIPGNMAEAIAAWPAKTNYADDETFLAEIIWPQVKDDAMVHGRRGVPFPTPLEHGRFVGERIHHDEHEGHEDRRTVLSNPAIMTEPLQSEKEACCKKGKERSAGVDADPAAWGPGKWRELHSRPDKPKAWDLKKESDWLVKFVAGLPCSECRMHFTELMTRIPANLSSQDAYFEWTVTAHNDVNARLGKSEFTVAEAATQRAWRNAEADRVKTCRGCEHFAIATATTGPKCRKAGLLLKPRLGGPETNCPIGRWNFTPAALTAPQPPITTAF